MDKNGKIFLIASLTVIVVLLFTSGVLYMTKESEKDKKVSLQRQVDSLLTEKQNLETKLKEAEIATVQSESNIKFQDEKISMLNKSIEDEKIANSKNLTKIQEKEFEIQHLKDKIDEVKAEKMVALKDLEKLYKHHLALELEFENLAKAKEELDNRSKEIAEKEGVSLGTVVIKQPRN